MDDQRQQMVQSQLVPNGIRDAAVLRAMASVPRHLFVPPAAQRYAYDNKALPLDESQSISQPYIVALMAQALELRGHERVLEVGTGSGYAAAVLSLIAAEVITVERSPALAGSARERLARLGYENVTVVEADGTLGWHDGAPYGGISVPAAAPWVPNPLRQQLADDARLVIPVGSRNAQMLLRLTRHGDEVHAERLVGVQFVPLIGRHSWAEDDVSGTD
jgi:protein-L-isoaspartate(D-aspartate) O-methyltransferase